MQAKFHRGSMAEGATAAIVPFFEEVALSHSTAAVAPPISA
jgi:hypothetical protein